MGLLKDLTHEINQVLYGRSGAEPVSTPLSPPSAQPTMLNHSPSDNGDGSASTDELGDIPCAGGCGFQKTWHPTHCCGVCKASFATDHGPRCEKKVVGGK